MNRFALPIIALMIGLVCATGCSPRQGYPGPERPLSEVAVISPGSFSSDVLYGSANVDGMDFRSNGIALLPGSHKVTVSWRLKGPKLSCEKTSDFDSWGFNSCRKQERKRNRSEQNCSCWDYVSVTEVCQHEVVPVTCADKIDMEAGVEYELVPTGDLSSPQVEVMSPVRGWLLACKRGAATTESFETDLGTGFYTAQQAGVLAPSACFL